MLAETVEGFGEVGGEAVDDVIGRVAVDGDWIVGARDAVPFACEGLAVGGGEGEVAASERDGDGQVDGLEGRCFVVFAELKWCAFA